MREMFKEAASHGVLPQSISLNQESSITLSAPVLSVSTDKGESPVTIDEHPKGEVEEYSKKVNHGRGESLISSSGPVLSVSADRSESPVLTNELPKGGVEAFSKRVNHGQRAKQAVLSSPRRSPRFKVLSFSCYLLAAIFHSYV
uniref:Uncharacterized protein n=1 Tax=Rhizophora mucronata TaxID=61149 RepID=A0A2P2NNS3_RHIMU